MNCCSCKKEVDITKCDPNGLKAPWYGKYIKDKPVKVICIDCIIDKDKKEKYLK